MKERQVSRRRNLNRRKFANIDFPEQVTPYMPKEKYFRRVAASFDSLAGNEVLTSQPTFFYLLMLFPFAQK